MGSVRTCFSDKKRVIYSEHTWNSVWTSKILLALEIQITFNYSKDKYGKQIVRQQQYKVWFKNNLKAYLRRKINKPQSVIA